MNKTRLLFLVFAAALVGTVSPAFAKEYPANYVTLKGGVYSPSNSYKINTFNGGSTRHLDSKTGFAGEVAFGHYFLPMLALELGGGYFESKGSPAAEAGDAKLKVVPVLATIKALFPLGVVEPYGEFGIGAHFTKLEVEGHVYNFNTTSKITYGLHAGAGVNFNITDAVYLGVEGKYLWAKPSYGGQDIKLDGFIATADLGFRF